MAVILLNKIINKEVDVNVFIKWLLENDSQCQYCEGSEALRCSRTEFLTYFLNFVHEEIPCSGKQGETPQKSVNCRRVELSQNDDTPAKRKPNSLINEDRNDISKSATYPLALNKTTDVTPNSSQSNLDCSSTPIISKFRSELIVNDAYISPISPLYRNYTNFSTPNNVQSFTSKSSEKITPLCLGDFIVNRRSSGKKKTSRSLLNGTTDEGSKRIKPTSLTQIKSSSSFLETNNSFNSFQDTKEIPVDDLNESRNYLAEERLKILSRRDSVISSTKTITSLVNLKKEVNPDVNAVTYKDELNCFIEIYVALLKNSLVLNITSEIYLLISLLVTKRYGERRETFSTDFADDMPTGVDFLNIDDVVNSQNIFSGAKKVSVSSFDLFETVHNVVYFAVKCLETQVDVLKYYDKSTLSLLSKNKRLQLFSAVFADKLRKISEKKNERVVELNDSNSQTNVCFNLDTDNRENFPNDTTFHTFRKQRDIFYEILRVWEQQHLVTGWNFSVSMGGKIKGLFSLQSDPMTYVHFCRLFKAQLLTTCGKNLKGDNFSDMSFLSSIPNVNVDKLNRLNCRLVTKQSPNGINAAPVFTDHQEFYRDFIIIAANYMFNKHLCDSLIMEIIELNDTKFGCSDLEDIDGFVDPSTRKSYVTCVKSLRTLAKFLGFVESLPYKSDDNTISGKVLTFQISLRKEISPVFDVQKLLKDALKQNNVVLTIPWLTKYLSMLDYVSLRLPYYVSVIKTLFNLYRNCDKILGKSNCNNYNISLVKFCLGWLFELPHFPDADYFNFCTTSGCDSLFSLNSCKIKNKEYELDRVEVVDQNFLYLCCPYLDEIKKLLSSNSLSNSVTSKHITPLTAAQSFNEIAKKKVEQQLEEAFFNGQPLSVRKTVEFVAERVASACVKYICSNIVPAFKKRSIDNLKESIQFWVKNNNVNSPTKEKSLKAALRTKVDQMAQTDLQSLKDICEKEACVIIEERVPSSIANLLSIDVLLQTRDVCIAISKTMCLERVRQWIKSHVNLTVFAKDFNSEMQKVLTVDNKKPTKEKLVVQLPPGGSSRLHNDESTSAFHVLEKLKCLSLNVLENSPDMDEETVMKVLNEALVTLMERSDVNECITWYTCTILVDVALLLITHKPGTIHEDLLKKFVLIWKCRNVNTGELFKNLFCPRNVMLLAQSCNDTVVWSTLATFVAFLLKENVLTPEELELQCTAFYQKDWDQSALSNFARFLYKFLECYRRDGGDSSKFTLVLGFLSDYCNDL